jgi:hypothetical protein
MPLLFPLDTESTRQHVFCFRSAVTVTRQSSPVFRSTVEVTRAMDDSLLRTAVDAENGDAVPMIIDVVNSLLR